MPTYLITAKLRSIKRGGYPATRHGHQESEFGFRIGHSGGSQDWASESDTENRMRRRFRRVDLTLLVDTAWRWMATHPVGLKVAVICYP